MHSSVFLITMENLESSYPLLDLSQIEMLIEDGDAESIEMFREILELFEQECGTKFSELRNARETGDVTAFANASHTLGGSSANIGGAVVWKMARSMENNCKSGDPQEAFAMLDQLEAEFTQTLVQMKAYVATYP